MSVRRTATVAVKEGVVADYVHNQGRGRPRQDRRARGAREHGRRADAVRARPPARDAHRRRAIPLALDISASRPISWRARRRSCSRRTRASRRRCSRRSSKAASRPTPRKTACWSRISSSTSRRRRAGPEGGREDRGRARSRSPASRAMRWAKASTRRRTTSRRKSQRPAKALVFGLRIDWGCAPAGSDHRDRPVFAKAAAHGAPIDAGKGFAMAATGSRVSSTSGCS